MIVLAIDTSSAQCAVAVSGVSPVAEVAPMQRGHAEALFPMIEQVMARAGLTFQDIGRIGVCTGPGSFTGLRVGVSAARGLALGLGVTAVGITRFAALAPVGFDGVIHLAGRQGTRWAQRFQAGAADGEPWVEDGTADDLLPDPMRILELAAAAPEGGPRPAPLYLRGADAALPSTPPPKWLD
ncbi:MAG: tRNA (adenosine(37)-N6)-threonylcarbamoyltransferase complex dimerization subunit type 1 TsaB [Pseudomonadota bacterium]